jgi:TRAP-type mannitol/chloroaromatic compound transport system substrate-binding protein
MGGWFRKEIKTVKDLEGLRMRVGGLAGSVMAKLGVVAQHIPGGEIYTALERGTIEAADWVGPHDDEKLGFNKVARFYYTPGMWKGAPSVQFVTNNKALEALPPEYREILATACHEGHNYMLSRYDAANPAAIKRLVSSGTQLRALPKPVLDALHTAAHGLYAELSGKSADFKKLYDHHFGALPDMLMWARVLDKQFDDYMISATKPA